MGTGPCTLKNALTTPDNGTTIETHGPYQHGGGFPAVNGQLDCPGNVCMFDANIPINVKQASTGAALQNVFASEFGCSVMSSFECKNTSLLLLLTLVGCCIQSLLVEQVRVLTYCVTVTLLLLSHSCSDVRHSRTIHKVPYSPSTLHSLCTPLLYP
jgi:hypothetical protein